LTVAGNGKVVDEHDEIDCLKLLHAAGWCVGDTAFVTQAGKLSWLVYGTNGENIVRAEGETRAAARRAAWCQAGAVGMLPGWRVSQPGAG